MVMKLEKAEEKTTCVPVKNLKDLPHEKRKRQGERERKTGQITVSLNVCAKKCVFG